MPRSDNHKNNSLSRERIIDAAYEIAKKDPEHAMSMRKIANKLGVTPMAIYKYFSDKNELIAAVIDNHMEQSNLIPNDIDPTDWRAWIRSALLRMWDAYDAAPNMVQYMTKATSFGPTVLSWQNETLKVLINAGLTPKQALTAHATMAELATGSSILITIRRQGMQTIFPTLWNDLQKGHIPDLDSLDKLHVSDFPWLLMCGPAMLEDMQDSRRAFANELDLILDGLAMQIERNQNEKTAT